MLCMFPFVKVAKVVTKVVEIAHFVAAALILAAAVCALAAPQYLHHFVEFEPVGNVIVLSAYSFEVITPSLNGLPDLTVFSLYGFGAVTIFVLIALIFHNIYSVIEKSEGRTPFQMDNVRKLKWVGVFSIIIPVVGFVMGSVIKLAVGVDAVEVSGGMDGLIMGIIVLCLTQFFAHGVELEDEVEGLL